MSQLKKSLTISALILAFAVPASAMISNAGSGSLFGDSSSLVRISGNTASLTSIVGSANAGKAANQRSSLFSGKPAKL